MHEGPKVTAQVRASRAQQVLDLVGEAILKEIRQVLISDEPVGEPIRYVSEIDSTSQPPSIELRFENTSHTQHLYQCLPIDPQIDVYCALSSSIRYTINQYKPSDIRKEPEAEVYIFNDQSAVVLIEEKYRRDEPLFFPTLRAISWKQPVLLVGDPDCPTEMNLYRLGYREAIRTIETILYSHYDPSMPLVGYGYVGSQFHVTVFNKGESPKVVTVVGTLPGTGQFVDLRQAKLVSGESLVGSPVAEKPVVSHLLQPLVLETRYPDSLLEQANRQFAVELIGENAKRLLNGQKTDVVTTGDGNTGKLYVLNTPDDGPQLVLQDVQQKLTLKESYLGHIFSEKDKANLHKYGDMGRVAELIDKQSGQKFTGFIGVDKDTKTLTVLRVDVIRPKIERMSHLKGVTLNGLQKQRLIEGKAVRLDNMTSKAGTSFSAYVRVSAVSRGLRFDHIPTATSEKNGSITASDSGGKNNESKSETANAPRAKRASKANS
ncbi:DUF3945 domain-containing protein [Spirosoma pulveris]